LLIIVGRERRYLILSWLQ